MRPRPLSLLLLALAACGAPEKSPSVPAAPSASPSTSASAATAPIVAPDAPKVVLAADAKQVTAEGTSVTAPAGWTMQAHGGWTTFTAPEGDLQIAVIDTGASTADEAIAVAWKRVHAGFARPLKTAVPKPGRHGWDEQRNYDYETSPNEKLYVAARAVRRGQRWTVLTIEGGLATLEKRLSSLSRVGDSLAPAGWAPESFAGKTAHALDQARVERILAAADKAREAAGVPGEGIALVQGGKIVFEGGLGVKELGKPDKVGARTAFLIASNTKALTTLLLAKLVDEKKLAWDTPAKKLFPDFKLGDAATTEKVLVSHLICACTGMPRQDMEWILQFQKQTPRSCLDALGGMQPTTKFGETFQYSNGMAAAAGFLGGYVLFPKKELGAAYDEAMQSRVFGPLGMKDSTFDFARALAGDRAIGHALDVDGKPARALMELNRSVIPVRPAGGAWSSAHDVASYVRMELANGLLPDGKRYVSEEALLARRKPQVAIGEFASYGMGLMVDREWGVDVVHHGGDLFGYHSDMFWIPAANVGGVFLTNGDGWLVRRAFLRKVVEELYDGHAEADDDAAAAVARHRNAIAVERKRLTVPAEPAITAKLAKRYRHPTIGDLTVTTDAAGAALDLGGWKSPVATRKNDDGTVSLVTIAPAADDLAFVIAERDGKRALIVRDLQHEYAFVEVQ